MSDFFDVPEFDGKGLFLAASASQWGLQENRLQPSQVQGQKIIVNMDIFFFKFS